MNTKKIILLVLILAVLGGIIFALWRGNTRVAAPAPATTETIIPEKFLPFFEAKGEIKFPEVSNEVVITYEELPESVRYLISENASPFKATKKFYKDGSNGYGATFRHSANVLETYLYFKNITTSKYTYLEGRRTQAVAISIVENPQYVIRLSLLQDMEDPGMTEVIITAQAK